MAVTKIWKIETNMEYTITYVKNEKKTQSYAYVTTRDGQELHDIDDVIGYAMQTDKVLDHVKMLTDDGEVLKEYVTGINCCKDTAYKEFLYTKLHFEKTDKILAWHGYQSFKPGEVTPEEAHEIGVELANALWGDRFQVVVTTHLDRKHIHNHFVLNSVSFVDGYKYYGNKATYFKMRTESDRICREHGLSVIENPKYNGVTRGAYRAGEEGRYTISDIVKEDIDNIITCSNSINDFLYRMKKSGYTVDASGKYLTVIPYKRKAVRVDRRWGDEYSLAGITERIAKNKANGTVRVYVPKTYHAKGSVPQPRQKLTGYRALYVRYLYMLGKLPPKRGMSAKQTHFLMREDLLKLNTMREELDFMRDYDIASEYSLKKTKSTLENDYRTLNDKRNSLRNKIRRAPADKKNGLQEELRSLNADLKVMRKRLFYCDDIMERSKTMTEKMNKVKEFEMNFENERGNENGRITGG
ncbi:MAG: relaxase/mobilization nuclease domain-containing protein [Clostridium sp.]|nr:relaxase/mobilization nuclease domain-containing protein [Clostridium sp.]